MKRTLIALMLVTAMPFSQAQTASLESRLRDQLRETRTQLQDLQAQQAQWATEKASLEKARDAARQDAEAAGAAARRTSVSPEERRALAQERQRREAAEASLQRGNAAADATAAELGRSQAERERLAKELDTVKGQVDACTARNVRMYRVGQEVIAAYEHIDAGDVFASRQPFAARARARLDNAAQSFGDRLYEQRFDPRMGQTAASP